MKKNGTGRMTIVVLGLLACALPAGAAAQHDRGWTGYSETHRRNDCRLAHQVLTKGRPAEKRAWALSVIGACGEAGGEALAHALEAQRSAAVPSAELESVVRAGFGLLDARLLGAALSIADDPGAGPVARIQAARVLYALVSPAEQPSFEQMVGADDAEEVVFDTHPVAGAPLPADYRARIEAAMDRVAADPATPPALAHAARRTATAARVRAEWLAACPAGRSREACLDAVRRARGDAPR